MALKIMAKHDVIETKQTECMKRERQILESLESPFCISFLSSFQDDRRIFLLLEFCHGGDLFLRMKYEGRLPVADSKFYSCEIILAFKYLHLKGILYRSLKPENIVIDRDGHLKLVDFAMSRKLGEKEVTSTVIGTPEYGARNDFEAGS